MPQKLYIFFLSTLFFLCSVNAFAIYKADKTVQNNSTAITVVSDTSDNEETQAVKKSADTSYNVSPSTTRIRIVNPDLTSHSFWVWLLSKNGPFSLFHGVGGNNIFFIIINLIILFLIFFFPLLLVLLVIFLIVRDQKRKNLYKQRMSTNFASEQASSTYFSQDPNLEIEKKKDKAILHIAIGIGIVIFFLIFFNWEFGIGVGIIFICYGTGQYINAQRAQRRNKNQNNENISE